MWGSENLGISVGLENYQERNVTNIKCFSLVLKFPKRSRGGWRKNSWREKTNQHEGSKQCRFFRFGAGGGENLEGTQVSKEGGETTLLAALMLIRFHPPPKNISFNRSSWLSAYLPVFPNSPPPKPRSKPLQPRYSFRRDGSKGRFASKKSGLKRSERNRVAQPNVGSFGFKTSAYIQKSWGETWRKTKEFTDRNPFFKHVHLNWGDWCMLENA